MPVDAEALEKRVSALEKSVNAKPTADVLDGHTDGVTAADLEILRRKHEETRKRRGEVQEDEVTD